MSKNVLNSRQIMTNGDMSQTSISSDVINVLYLDNIGLQIEWTGTATGTITVQASIDGTTYYALTFDPALAQPAGSASGYLVSLNQLPYKYFKVVYTKSSGTGTMNVYCSIKEV